MRVLVVKPVLPWPPNQGTKRVTLALLKALAAEHEVTLVAPALTREAMASARSLEEATGCRVVTRLAPNRRSLLHRAGYKVGNFVASLGGGHSPRVLYSSPRDLVETAAALSRAPGRPFDLAIFEYWYSYPYIRRVEAARRVLLAHDAEFAVNELAARGAADRLPLARRLWARTEARREIEACRLVDRVWTLTDMDGDLLARAAGLGRDHFVTLPFGVDTTALAVPEGATGNDVLFFGSFAADFNRDALIYLLDGIWPLLRKARPAARLVVAGGGLPDSLRRLVQSAGADYAGEVGDLRALYASAAAVIIPLRFGGGLRIRLLEALACSRAVVATPVAVLGMRGADGLEFIVRDNPGALARAVQELLDDPARRATLGRAGRRLVEAHYSEAVAASGMRRMARDATTGAASR